MRLSNKYGGIQFFAQTPEIHVMLLSVENYSAEHWGLYWIRINGESIDPNDDGLVAYFIKDGDIIQIPLSHPSTIVDGTTYDSGADAEDIFVWVKKQPYVDTERMFLSGHSMGGYIAASCAPKIQPHGLILLCPGARLWFSCDQMAQAMKQMGQDYIDVESVCFKASFNDEMAKHPDPFTEAKGYDGPVMLMRADDDDQVDEETCLRYAQVYQNAKL